MRVLHLFGWPIKDIKSIIPTIKEQGFSAIQISSIQPSKEENSGYWWMPYQPTRFKIGNRFGTKEELEELCREARNYDIPVIADIICNHMGGANDGSLRPNEKVDPSLTGRSDFWKTPRQITDWNNRYEVTNYCMGLPGLNVANHDLQDIIISFLNELIDCGVSGFRFDAAKSIGLPEEGCDFWPPVITSLKRNDLILYGEVIFADYDLIDSYNRFISVLTNCDGRNRDRIVCFVESHDSYYDYKYTTGMPSDKIANDYRGLTSKYHNTLFFTRPFDDAWKSPVVREANKVDEYIYRKQY